MPTGGTEGRWQALSIGGGGFNTGIAIAPDGKKDVRTDTYGAYIQQPGDTTWRQILTTTSMRGDLNIETANTGGVYEIIPCPKVSTTHYMIWQGFVYKSTNDGATWTKTARPSVAGDPNSQCCRTMGPFLAVDPADTTCNNLIAGSATGKPDYSTDGGATWHSIRGIAAPRSKGNLLIAYDPTTSSGGATPGIYISSYGTGVYRSTTGPAGTFTLTTGTPTTHRHMVVDQSGGVYLTTDGNDPAQKFNSGSWSTFGPSDTWNGVAVDPTNPARIALDSLGGGMRWSNGGTGGTFNQVAFDTTINGDAPWQALSHANNPSLSNGGIAFDPTQPGTLYVSWGFGTMTTPIPTTSTRAVTYASQVTGIEQLVGIYVLAPPGASNVVLGAEDLPAWYKTQAALNSNAKTVRPIYHRIGDIQAGISFDYAPETPTTVVGVIESVLFAGDISGVSTDGGNTWTQLSNVPPGAGSSFIGGNIAMASATNWCWGEYGGGIYKTSNAAASAWTTAKGISTHLSPGSLAAFGVVGNVLAADKVKTGTFYAYVAGDGIYKSTDGCTSFSKVHAALEPAHDGYWMQLRVNPTVAGDLWYTPGIQFGSSHPVNELLWRSRDGGITWTSISGFQEVTTIGFGAQVSGQSYPSIAVIGWKNGTYGIWQSMDNGSTWTQIGPYPQGNAQYVVQMDGDKLIQGKWYISMQGSGFKQYTP